MAQNNQFASATLIDQYKAYLADIAAIGSRYSTAQSFYVSIVSILLAALAVKDVVQWQQSFLWMPSVVFFFIALICFLWRRTLLFYQGLFAIKFGLLRRIEKEGGFYPLFEQEKQAVEKNDQTKNGLIAIEAAIPRYLFWIALVLGTLSFLYYVGWGMLKKMT